MKSDDVYRWEDREGHPQWGDILYGPDGWECGLSDPEDRTWFRDGREAVDRLNEQHREIMALRAENERLREMTLDLATDLDYMVRGYYVTDTEAAAYPSRAEDREPYLSLVERARAMCDGPTNRDPGDEA